MSGVKDAWDCSGLDWEFGTLCHIYPARHYQTSRISHREYAISF